jgi:hypothetical protein
LDDVRVVPSDLGDGVLEPDRRVVGIAIIPCLTELHVELQDSKGFHAKVGMLVVRERSTRKRDGTKRAKTA